MWNGASLVIHYYNDKSQSMIGISLINEHSHQNEMSFNYIHFLSNTYFFGCQYISQYRD